MKAELTATKRVGLHRYSFNDKADRNVMLDLGHVLQPNWGHRILENTVRQIDDKTFEGVHKTSVGQTIILLLFALNLLSR